MIVFDLLCRSRVLIAYVGALGVGFLGCTAPESAQQAGPSSALTQAQESFDLTRARVVDLTYSYDQDTIYWQAYALDGTNTGNNTYKIYFDPFKKPSLTADSNDNGKTKTQKTKKNNEIPTGVEFKYTIWADACATGPLDPRFQVQ